MPTETSHATPSQQGSSSLGEGSEDSEQQVDVSESVSHPSESLSSTADLSSKATENIPVQQRHQHRQRGNTTEEDDALMDVKNHGRDLLDTRTHFDSFRSMINRLMADFDESIGGGLLSNRRLGIKEDRPVGSGDRMGSRSNLIGQETSLPSLMNTMMSDILQPTLDLSPLAQPVPIKIDIESFKHKYKITAEVPGVKPKDLKVNVDNGILTIEGRYEDEHHDEDKDGTYLVVERSYGSVHRSIRLPQNVDTANIKCNYDHGTLKLTLPKKAHVDQASGNVKIEMKESSESMESSGPKSHPQSKGKKK